MNALSRDCSAISLRDAEAARALWCAVLMEQWVLATDPNPSDDEAGVIKARRWFGSKWFYRVCALAGVEADFILGACHKRGFGAHGGPSADVGPLVRPGSDAFGASGAPVPRGGVLRDERYSERDMGRKMRSMALAEGGAAKRPPVRRRLKEGERAIDIVFFDLKTNGPSTSRMICQRLHGLAARKVNSSLQNLKARGMVKVVRRLDRNRAVWDVA